MRSRSRSAIVLATVLGLLLTSVAALAKPPSQSGVVERIVVDSGFVYSGDGVHVLTGPPLEQGCPTTTAQFINRPNETVGVHFRSTERIHVFDGMRIADVFEWLG